MNCVHCNRGGVIKEGVRKTENRGGIQIYYCKNCNKRFSSLNFYRMKNREDVIIDALHLHKQGLSTREVEQEIYRKYKVNISHASIHNWINEFSEEVDFMDDYKITIEGKEFSASFKIKTDKDYILSLVNKLIKKPVLIRNKWNRKIMKKEV